MSLPPGLTRLALASVVFISHFSFLAIGAPAVYAFFALSGYWIAGLWSQQQGSAAQKVFSFITARWFRLAPLLAVALVGQLLVHHFLSTPPAVPVTFLWWLKQSLIFGSGRAGLILPQQWSLDVEMQFYLAAPFLCLALSRCRPSLTWPLAAACILAGASLIFIGTSITAPSLLPNLGFFLAGIVFHSQRHIPAQKWLRWLPVLLIVLVAATPHLRSLLNSRHITADSPPQLITQQSLLVIAIGIAFLPLILPTVLQPSSRFDRLLGDLAYPVYLIHWWFRSIVYQFRPPSASGLHKALDTSAAALATLLLSLVLLLCLDRPLQRWRKHRLTP